MLFATFVSAWVIYIRLAMFLKPDSSHDIGDDHQVDDDMFVQDLNKSAFEKRRDVIRKNYKP